MGRGFTKGTEGPVHIGAQIHQGREWTTESSAKQNYQQLMFFSIDFSTLIPFYRDRDQKTLSKATACPEEKENPQCSVLLVVTLSHG